jgi:hypothetical protein
VQERDDDVDRLVELILWHTERAKDQRQAAQACFTRDSRPSYERLVALSRG